MASSSAPNLEEWKGKGYFKCPVPPATVELPRTPTADPWLWWLMALTRAKAGNFDLLPGLVDLMKQAEDPILQSLSAGLLGEAGTPACFDRILRELETTEGFELTLDFCDALATRGRLADVPVLLRADRKFAEIEDAEVIPHNLSRLLESEAGVLYDPGPSVDEYHALVMKRHDDLAEQFGTTRVYVYRGRKFSVVLLARLILDEVRKLLPPIDLRRRFEAATGIDCSAFFDPHDTLQPLTAEAIVEEFLESPEAENSDEGVRYFFGHRIPD